MRNGIVIWDPNRRHLEKIPTIHCTNLWSQPAVEGTFVWVFSACSKGAPRACYDFAGSIMGVTYSSSMGICGVRTTTGSTRRGERVLPVHIIELGEIKEGSEV